MSASKDKGTKAETAVVNWLRENGYPNAERRALRGARDCGDIAGLPIVVEVKNEKRLDLAAYVDEANAEGANAGQPAVCLHKRRGHTDPGRWYVTMDGATLLRLLSPAAVSGHDDEHEQQPADQPAEH